MITEIQPLDIPVMTEQQSVSGIDELFAPLNSELACINLIAYSQPEATHSRVAATIIAAQEGATLSTVQVPYSAQRKNAERLEKFGLIKRTGTRHGKSGEQFDLTDRGILGSSLAGHLLGLAIKHNINLSDLLGPKVRAITDKVDDNCYNLSTQFVRVLLLIATKNFPDANGEVSASRYPKLPGVKDIVLHDDIKVGHVENLAELQFLGVKKRIKKIVRNGKKMPNASNRFFIPTTKVEFVEDLEDIVRGISYFDEEIWPVFVQEGFTKGLNIINKPNSVVQLLTRRALTAETGYSTDQYTLRSKAIELAKLGTLSTGALRRALGDKHSLQHLSKSLTAMVNEGILDFDNPDGSNRRRFFIVE